MKTQNKGLLSEQDLCMLLQRYSVSTILALPQEMAHCEGVKFDWDALVKNTSTGISDPREFQMLWRHLAYRHTLLDALENEAELMDDDSDLEFELEASPSVTSDAATEAAAYVRVLIASGLLSEGHSNNSTVQGPLTISIPNSQSSRGTSVNSHPFAMQAMNITVPVFVPKQPLPGESDAIGTGGGFPPRRKRKPWSQEEDSELIAAVKKIGEGSWANILRTEFKGDRTASQLSQRWSIIRRRVTGNVVNAGGAQLSEAQRAARHAMNLALDPPAKSITTSSPSGSTLNNASGNSGPRTTTAEPLPAQHQSQQSPTVTKPSSLGASISTTKPQVTLNKTSLNNVSSNSGPPTTTAEPLPAQHQSQQRPPVTKLSSLGASSSTTKPQVTLNKTSLNNASSNSVPPTTTAEPLAAQHQSQQRPPVTKPSSLGASSSTTKPQVTLNKTSTMSSLSSDPVMAAAVAAGARIATQSDAASLLKAAQAKNAIHIMPTGGSSKKSSIPGVVSTHLEGHPNVHFISSGLAVAPLSNRPSTSSGLNPGLVKVPSPGTPNKPSTSTPLRISTEQAAPEQTAKQDAKLAGGVGVSRSEDLVKDEVQENGACAAGNEPIKADQEAESKSQVAAADSSKTLPKVMTNSDPASAVDMKAESKPNPSCSKTTDFSIKEEKSQFTSQADGQENTNGAKMLCSPTKAGENHSADLGEVKQTANSSEVVGENPPALQAEVKQVADASKVVEENPSALQAEQSTKVADSAVKEEGNQLELQAEGNETGNSMCS